MCKIIVVEGKNDYSKIKKVYPDANVVITNGSAVSDELLNKLEKLSKNNEIVLFLDPDYPGERIRKIISERIPNCSHAFVEKSKAISKNKKKVGVEHITDETLVESLGCIKESLNNSDITNDFLYDLGLIGTEDSMKKRSYLCSKLLIGYVNGKQLLKRLKMFGIMQKDVLEALNDWEYK